MQVGLAGADLLHFSIYTGDCGELACAANQFVGLFPLTWDSVEGETYSVFVYARELALSESFTITVEEVDRPENDLCENSILIEANEIYEGTTHFSSTTSDDPEVCGDASPSFFGGVWYSFIGSGSREFVGVDSYDAEVSVYSGPSCDDLTCVTGSEGGFFMGEYLYVSFNTTEGETYYFFVTGIRSSRGNFSISILDAATPENDSCNDAVVLELGDTVQGTTTFASRADDFDFGDCGNSTSGNVSDAGVWYTIEGGGFPSQVSIQAEYDMQLTVMTGDSCETLECVDGTSGFDGNFFSGQVIWDAEEGTTYYIYVHGIRDTGDFEMDYTTAIF